MTVQSRGRICVWEAGSLWIADTEGQFEPHAHHAVQVTLALAGEFTLEAEGLAVSGPAAVVASDVSHAFRAQGLIVHVFVEPESRAGRALTEAWCAGAPLSAVPASAVRAGVSALRAAVDAGAGDDELAAIARALVDALAPAEVKATAPDPRVREVIDWAARRVEEPLSLEEAAEVAGLSPSRTRHLFVAETGVPFRSYVLWLRVMRAVRSYAAGAPLTEAAYDAGFADSAHLSRTFRRTFGTTASTVAVA